MHGLLPAHFFSVDRGQAKISIESYSYILVPCCPCRSFRSLNLFFRLFRPCLEVFIAGVAESCSSSTFTNAALAALRSPGVRTYCSIAHQKKNPTTRIPIPTKILRDVLLLQSSVCKSSRIFMQSLTKPLPAGAKAHPLFAALSARLKSGPVTKQMLTKTSFYSGTAKAVPFQNSSVTGNLRGRRQSRTDP